MNNDEQTTTDPVVKVARDLSAILELTGHLSPQAMHKANDPLMPGGKAMVALADVANLEAWENQFEGYERHNARNPDAAVNLAHIEDEDDTWEPPLQTLAFWSEQWRAHHGAEYGTRPTVTSEAAFIRWALDWAWDNEIHFEAFARDMNKARVRLENLLYAGKRAERTRVPCINPECERQPRLIKVYGNTAARDHYKCTACKHLYDQHDYARAKLRLLDAEGADRHVKMQDARDAIDRPERTWRKWIRLWHVRSYRDPRTGQVWVWWPDVREMDQSTQRRQRSA